MKHIYMTSFLFALPSIAAFLQCPVCSNINDPTSCTSTIDCDVNFDVCELTIHLNELNRIEFTCSTKSKCSQEETPVCNPLTLNKCVFCCNNLGICREQAFLVFSDLLSTTTTKRTSPVETGPTTAVVEATPPGPNMCIQCSKNVPCEMDKVNSLQPTVCNVEYPYCFTTVIQTGTSQTIYKGCAEHDFCLTKYWQDTMNKPICLTGDYANLVVNCTFCCTGTGCNIPEKPEDHTLLQIQ